MWWTASTVDGCSARSAPRGVRMAVVLLSLLLAPSLGQDYSSTSDGQVNECRIDDLHLDYLQPLAEKAVLTIASGVCMGRSNDESYSLGSITTPGINVSFSKLYTRLSDPSCISIIANTVEGNTAPLVTFYDKNLTVTGTILLTQTQVTLTIRESIATFNFTRRQAQREHARLQLCTAEDRVDFYSGCEFVASQPFVNAGFSDSDTVGLMKDITDDSALAYKNGVAGLYFVTCSGHKVKTEDITNFQCIANPPNCSESITHPPEVVSNYVAELQGPLPTSTMQPHSGTTGTQTVPVPSVPVCRAVTTPTPDLSVCDYSRRELNDAKSEARKLQSALISVSVILIAIIAALSVALVTVCLLWRQQREK